MKLSRVLNLCGSIPLVGSGIGIYRICNAKAKNKDEKVKSKANQVFAESYSKSNTDKQKLKGAFEIIPVVGPLLYWGGRLIAAIASKIHQLVLSKSQKNSPARNPTETLASQQNQTEKTSYEPIFYNVSNVRTCADLKQYCGQKIILLTPRYASSSFDEDHRELNCTSQPQKVTGVLKSVSDEPFYTHTGTDRYQITFENQKGKEEVYYLSNQELEFFNTNRYQIV